MRFKELKEKLNLFSLDLNHIPSSSTFFKTFLDTEAISLAAIKNLVSGLIEDFPEYFI